jgi:hypothetical protein
MNIKKETQAWDGAVKKVKLKKQLKNWNKPAIPNPSQTSYAKTVKYYDVSLDYGGANNNYFHIKNVPPSVAKTWATGKLKVKLNERQNESPTMKEMIAIAEKYGGTLFGYVIPIESGREDARITFDGLILPVNSVIAQMLNKKYKPNEFDKQSDGYRFWWD